MPWSETAIVLGHAENGRELDLERHPLDVVPLGVALDRAEGVATEPIHVSTAELGHDWSWERTRTDRKP